MRLQTVIRELAELVLLVIVWRNAHWSVAVVLTGAMCEIEMLRWISNAHHDLLEELAKKFVDTWKEK